MKIRFSKTLAAVLAATTVTAVSGISALAATVTTTTEYDWNNRNDANATVNVTSVVTDTGNKDAQVTYLVATDPLVAGGIKYIDQAALDSTNGTATFSFTAKQSDIYGVTATAKFGSDASITMPVFTFNAGVDHFDNGTAPETFDVEETSAGVYMGTVSGNVTEYGIKITKDTTNYTFPAMGTLDGTFCVAIEGVDLTGWAVTGYAVRATN